MSRKKSDRVHSVMIAGIRVKVQHVAGMEDWGDCCEEEKLIRIRKEAIGPCALITPTFPLAVSSTTEPAPTALSG